MRDDYTFVGWLALLALVLFLACGPCSCGSGVDIEKENNNPNKDQQDPRPYDGDPAADEWYVDVCSIRTIFNFTDEFVTYMSNNEAVNLIVIYRVRSHEPFDRVGILGWNILFYGEADAESAHFKHDDWVEIAVYTGALDMLWDLWEKILNYIENLAQGGDSNPPEEDDLVCDWAICEL